MNDFLTEQKQNFNELYKSMEEKTKEEIARIKKRNEEAEEILGTMSINSLANGYKVIADNESQKALYWNLFSVISLIVLLGLGVHFIINQGAQITWSALTSRLIITGIGLTLFTYGAKQAGSHREEEKRNRKVQVELASLNPYLVDLEEQKQKEVKEALVEKYFGVEANHLTHDSQIPQNQK